MKTRTALHICTLFALVLTVTACSFPLFGSTSTTTTQETQPPITDQNLPVATENLPVVTEEPLVQSSGGPIPAGFMVSPIGQEKVQLYNLDGSLLGEINTPGGADLGPGQLALAGAVNGAQDIPPLVYRAFGENGASLMVTSGATATLLRAAGNFTEIAVAAGQDALVYIDVRLPTDGGYNLFSDCFLGSVASLTGNDTPTFSSQDADGYLFEPMGVFTEDGQMQGFFYARAPWGSGGDIVYRPRAGLYLYDATTGETAQVLSDSQQVVGLSPDLNWVAYIATDITTDPTLYVTNVFTGETVSFPVAAEHDRGAGNAVISPDNTYIAWEEASGWQMAEQPDFQSYLFIGQMDGTVLGSFTGSDFDAVTGTPTWSVIPVGWLDSSNLILNVTPVDYSLGTSIVIFNLTTGDALSFIQGTFAGFFYH